MKKSLLLASLLIAAGAAQAQITLTAATHMPKAGRAYYMAFDDTSATPTQPIIGANKTWNYSGVIASGDDTLDYFGCTPQTNCAAFGNANLMTGSLADTSYEYLKTGSADYKRTGIVTPLFSANLSSDPLDTYRYPFSYNTQFTDAASGTATSTLVPLPLTVTANDTVKGVGHGTITTPAGTFQNVLQVRSNITMKAMALGQVVAELRTVHYEWFEATSRFPVMTLSYLTTVYSGQTTEGVAGSYRIPAPAGVSSVAETAAAFQLTPNPANGFTRLEIPENSGAEATVLITDISGKVMFRQPLKGQSALTINTADWAKGIYLVRVQNAAGEASFQKLAVQ